MRGLELSANREHYGSVDPAREGVAVFDVHSPAVAGLSSSRPVLRKPEHIQILAHIPYSWRDRGHSFVFRVATTADKLLKGSLDLEGQKKYPLVFTGSCRNAG